jgi:phospholipid/cholesterol/gamma-HCH transport system ATP-binding protein
MFLKLATSWLDLSFLIVTHELRSVFTIADRIILLDQQRKGIVESGTPENIRDNTKIPWVKKFLEVGEHNVY